MFERTTGFQKQERTSELGGDARDAGHDPGRGRDVVHTAHYKKGRDGEDGATSEETV